MQLSTFADSSDLFSKSELDKVKFLAFYFLKTQSVTEFSIRDVSLWFADLKLARPNATRLKNNLSKSRSFIAGSTKGFFQLHASEIKRLESEYPELNENSEEIVCKDNTILPTSVFEGTGSGCIDSLARQINAAYEHNIFDGCAVLMRRLLEILLILSYRYYKIEEEIKEDKGIFYLPLEQIIGKAKNSSVLSLSASTKNNLENFRQLGNFSAHGIYYTAKRADIDKYSFQYRVIIQELLVKSNLKA